MRLLYLADIRFPLERANGIQTMETCHALAGRGHDVTLGVRADTHRPGRDPFAFYDLPVLDRLRIRTVALQGPTALRRAGYLWRAWRWAIEYRDHDVIFTRDLGVAAMVLRLPLSVRPPLVHESHSFAPAVAEALPRLVSGQRRAPVTKRRRLLRREGRVWRQADGYIVVPASLRSELEGRFGVRERVMTIPNGTRIAPERRFAPPRISATPLAVYAGHLYPWKGVDVLLRTLQGFPELRLLIIGGLPSDTDFLRIQALADDLHVADRVTFTGLVKRARVPELLATGDVLIIPNVSVSASADHTSPLKLFEYLASGKPIVASDLPSIRELLQDGENAVLVAPGDPGALAAGIKRVLDDHALAERISRRAFDQASDFAWARRAERIERLLDSVVSARVTRALEVG